MVNNMTGKQYHEKRRKEVLATCKEFKQKYGDDWPYVMQVLAPNDWTYLRTVVAKKRL